MTGKLLRHPRAPGADGAIHRLTPADAGWTYVGFEVLQLAAGQEVSRSAERRECCLVTICGDAAVTVDGNGLGRIGGRATPFDHTSALAYVPAGAEWAVRAETDCELAVCSAPAEGRLPPRLIPPAEVVPERRGHGTNLRHVRNILPDSAEAESLLVVEVVTPGGHWSSYPPHKHDVDDPPRETLLEEIYYHRLARPEGFAVQRVYTEDRSLDETMAVGDRNLVLVPRGFHPVGAIHGFDLYYLNVMAGPVRQWRFAVAAGYEFLRW